MPSKNIVIQALSADLMLLCSLTWTIVYLLFIFFPHIFFLYIVKNSNCAAYNKSVEVAQGLTTFLNLVYLGLKGGRGIWAEISERVG